LGVPRLNEVPTPAASRMRTAGAFPARSATDTPPRFRYAIAVGSNRARSRDLAPAQLVARAMDQLSLPPFSAVLRSDIITSAPIGPSRRRYANAVIIIETANSPPELLKTLQLMEQQCGRRRALRWGPRTLDLDILLWNGGSWRSPGLLIPHYAYRDRDFVLRPLVQIAPHWRDPETGLTAMQSLSQLKRPKPVDRSPSPH
jgi:2-amino-4-hydroxy-6-hydroxymethyldihydropteridine diphosphokinase